jgi:hypothetical protein
MLGRLQRRPGPAAPASDGLRFARDWSVALAALSLILAVPGAIMGSTGATLLLVGAGLALLSAVGYGCLAAYFGRRERKDAEAAGRAGPGYTGSTHDPGSGGALPKEILGDWLLSVCLFPLAAGLAFAIGTPGEGLASAATLGFAVAVLRLALRRFLPDTITMSEVQRAQLIRSVTLTGVIGAAGYVGVTIIAILGGDTWLPVWPAVVLGLLCGTQSVVQLAQATASARRDGAP